MAATGLYKRFLKGIGLIPKDSTENSVLGDLEVLTTDSKLHFHNGSINDAVVSETVQATITNKLLNSTNVNFVDTSDNSKKLALNLSGITAATIRTWVLPNVNDTFTGISATQTLTNKTIVASDNTISGLTNSNLSGSAAITNANLATMANNTIKGNISGVGATPSDLTGAQVATISGAITALTGDVTASGPGSSAATVNATASSTVSTIMKRDGSGKTALNGISLDGSTSGSIGINPPAIVTPYNITLPSTQGAASTVPTNDGTGVISWATPNSTYNVVATKTSNYSAVINDYIPCDSTSSFTITLPTAVGNSGKSIIAKKVTTDFNQVLFATTSSQTIDTLSLSGTLSLNTFGESICLTSDGANWFITDHVIPDYFTSYTPTILGFGAASLISAVWRRTGSCIEIRTKFTAGTVSGTNVSVSIPVGLVTPQSSTGIIPANGTGTEGVWDSENPTIIGKPFIRPNVSVINLTSMNAGNNSYILTPGNSYCSNNSVCSLIAIVPIAGWALF